MPIVEINGRWPLELPEHRAARPEWPWWEATRLAAMNTVIGPNSVVYDVGGEEGDFPALWSSWGAEVVIAEPNPRVWSNIKWIFEHNNLKDPLVAYQGFFGDTGEPIVHERFQWPESASGPLIADHGFCQLNERPDLPRTTIDHVTEATKPPSVITIDVEGSELHVLQGAADTLETWKPDVFVSIHPQFMAEQYGIENGVDAIKALMESYNYEATFLTTDHEEHWWFRA